MLNWIAFHIRMDMTLVFLFDPWATLDENGRMLRVPQPQLEHQPHQHNILERDPVLRHMPQNNAQPKQDAASNPEQDHTQKTLETKPKESDEQEDEEEFHIMIYNLVNAQLNEEKDQQQERPTFNVEEIQDDPELLELYRQRIS